MDPVTHNMGKNHSWVCVCVYIYDRTSMTKYRPLADSSGFKLHQSLGLTIPSVQRPVHNELLVASGDKGLLSFTRSAIIHPQ